VTVSNKSLELKLEVAGVKKITLKEGEALVLRSCRSDMTSYGGFKWPRRGKVEASDWEETRECGNGLHGLLWGDGSDYLVTGNGDDANYLVCKVKESDCVDINGKVKFPKATVVFVGSLDDAVAFIQKYAPEDAIINWGIRAVGRGKTVVVGREGVASAGSGGRAAAKGRGVVAVGSSGTAVTGRFGVAAVGDAGSAVGSGCSVVAAGNWGKAVVGRKGIAVVGAVGEAACDSDGTAVAGDYGVAVAGDDGIAIVGREGKATVGEHGIAIAGVDGRCSGGAGAKLFIKGMKNRLYRTTVKDLIKPGIFYKINARGKFVEAGDL
jgi:hypothetical protein